MRMGIRGAGVTVGTRGTTVSGGIPGTGLGFRQRVGNSQAPTRGGQQESINEFSLRIEDDGKVTANAGSERLPPRFVTQAFRDDPEGLAAWLEEIAEDRNSLERALGAVHQMTPSPEYVSQLVAQVFGKPKPKPPTLAAFNVSEPTPPPEPKRGGLAGLIPGLSQKRLRHFEGKQAQYELDRRDWKQRRAAHEEADAARRSVYDDAVRVWKERKRAFDRREAERLVAAELALEQDLRTATEALADRLSKLDWPLETTVTFAVSEDCTVVCLDVDLPEVEELPLQRAVMSTTGKRLLMKKISQKDARLLYACHVHGIALRLLGETFSILPAAKEVCVSGFSQRLQGSTGTINDEYLLSVRATRGQLAAIDYSALECVDPVQAVEELLTYRRSMTKTGVFRSVEPYSLNDLLAPAEADI